MPFESEGSQRTYSQAEVDALLAQARAAYVATMFKVPAPLETPEGVTYHPWADGHSMGFRAVHEDGRVEFIFFNPATDTGDGVPVVFLYYGDSPDVDAISHVTLFDEPRGPTLIDEPGVGGAILDRHGDEWWRIDGGWRLAKIKTYPLRTWDRLVREQGPLRATPGHVGG